MKKRKSLKSLLPPAINLEMTSKVKGLFNKMVPGGKPPATTTTAATDTSPQQQQAKKSSSQPQRGSPSTPTKSSPQPQQQEEENHGGDEDDEGDMFSGMEVNETQDDEAPKFSNPAVYAGSFLSCQFMHLFF